MPRRSTQRIGARAVGKLQARKYDYLVWDRDLSGFGVRMISSGRKVYIAHARGQTGSKRISLSAPNQAGRESQRMSPNRRIHREIG